MRIERSRPSVEEPVVRGRGPKAMSRAVRRLGLRLVGLGLLVVLIAVVALEVNVVARIDRIDDAFTGLGDRPPSASGETVLMIGTRPRPAGGTDRATTAVPWLADERAVESVMLVEIAEDRRSVELVSLPLAADLVRSVGEAPAASVDSVERLTGRRVDHLMAVDWMMLEQLGADNGTPATYRLGSSPEAQQAYLRPMLENTLHAELRKEPWNLYRVVRTAASGIAVDDEWSLVELHGLLFSLRDLRSANIGFATAAPG